jgi:hypothetical protein
MTSPAAIMATPTTASATPIPKTTAEVVLLKVAEDRADCIDTVTVGAAGVGVWSAKIQPLIWAPITIDETFMVRVKGAHFFSELLVYTVRMSPEEISL